MGNVNSGGERGAEIWLALGYGEGTADMRVVRNDAEMVDWLWEQCGPDYTGEESSTRAYWAQHVADEDSWEHLDDFRRWRCHFQIGETGHIEFIRLLDGVRAALSGGRHG